MQTYARPTEQAICLSVSVYEQLEPTPPNLLTLGVSSHHGDGRTGVGTSSDRFECDTGSRCECRSYSEHGRCYKGGGFHVSISLECVILSSSIDRGGGRSFSWLKSKAKRTLVTHLRKCERREGKGRKKKCPYKSYKISRHGAQTDTKSLCSRHKKEAVSS